MLDAVKFEEYLVVNLPFMQFFVCVWDFSGVCFVLFFCFYLKFHIYNWRKRIWTKVPVWKHQDLWGISYATKFFSSGILFFTQCKDESWLVEWCIRRMANTYWFYKQNMIDMESITCRILFLFELKSTIYVLSLSS